MAQQIIFYILAFLIVTFSILSVTSQRILRSATYLLLVLILTGGLYLQMGYEFLAGVQLSVYAGGILVLYVFSVLLTSHAGDKEKITNWKRIVRSAVLALLGFSFCFYIIYSNFSKVSTVFSDDKFDMHEIGFALMGTEKYQYLLPFEAISILLLACIIGGIMIARKR
jgi:NADH-quinone oxidoreductase subunit J